MLSTCATPVVMDSPPFRLTTTDGVSPPEISSLSTPLTGMLTRLPCSSLPCITM